jgi:hypothetical protein
MEYLTAYMVFWIGACTAALVISLHSRAAYSIFQVYYWKFLLVPWKVVIFIIAAAGITLMAPYTDDPTWDYVDAFGMSVLTFTTAPWAVGTFYRVARRMAPLRDIFVPLCAMFFSASWSYDLYLLLRDGRYPDTWLPNLFASSFIYILAGLLWNLDWKKGRGVIFAFMEGKWPSPENPVPSLKIFWFALSLISIVAVLFLQFVWPKRWSYL